jgi:hypothetical protein
MASIIPAVMLIADPVREAAAKANERAAGFRLP